MDDAIDEPQFKFNRGTMKLSPDLSMSRENELDGEISSWTNTTNGCDERLHSDDQNDFNDFRFIKFKIIKVKTLTDDHSKKYVSYVIGVGMNEAGNDLQPTFIERRYTDFLELFSSLKQDHPNIMSEISFPRKLLMGNFSPDSILCRSKAFEFLLKFIAQNDKLRNSNSTTAFLQDKEYQQAKRYISYGDHSLAIPLLVNIFRLLNKLYTDRHPAVLRALCLLVACCHACKHQDTEKYAGLALRRFQGVSDFDLLQYYVPLLQICAQQDWTKAHKDNNYANIIKERLSDMKRRGMKVDGCLPLIDLLLQHVPQPAEKH